MAKINPKIKKLKEELRSVSQDRQYERNLRIDAEAKLSVYKEKDENKALNDVRYRRDLEDQVLWLRRLVEDVTIPSHKLDSIVRLREQEVDMINKGLIPPDRNRRY